MWKSIQHIYETPEILRPMIFSTVSCLQSDNGVSTSNKIRCSITCAKHGPIQINLHFTRALLKKEEIFDVALVFPATAHRFVNGFFLDHLWDVCSCGALVSLGAVERSHGWRATGKQGGISKCHVLRTPIADSRRFFAEALLFGLS